MATPKRMNFRKSSKEGRGGGHFHSKSNLSCIFCTFQQYFLSMKVKRKKLQHGFPKMRGGGIKLSKAVWNFSENLSVLVWPSAPYLGYFSLVKRGKSKTSILEIKICPNKKLQKIALKFNFTKKSVLPHALLAQMTEPYCYTRY